MMALSTSGHNYRACWQHRSLWKKSLFLKEFSL